MRYKSIDVLRGLMMVILTIDHVGGWFAKFTNQSLGFVSALEGFIFLSGLLFGIVYSKYLETSKDLLYKKTFKRAILIYKYSIINIIFFIIIYALKEYLKHSPISIQLFLKQIIMGVLYIYQPGIADILPTYVILILLSPIALIALKQNRLVPLLIGSFLIWVVGQFNIPFQNWLPVGNKLGFPSVLSYQFLFTIGIIFGYYTRHNKLNFRFPGYQVIMFFGLFILFFILRHFSGSFFNIPEYLTSRSQFSIIRLLNFFTIAYIVYWLISKKYFFENKFLEKLGQHSLYVFFYHVLVMSFVPYAIIGILPNYPVIYLLTLLVFVLSLYIPAWIHIKYVNQKKQ
jgi:hypothetical protein